MKEIWKDVPGWEEYYQVSTFGRARSKDRYVKYPEKYRDGYFKPGRILKQWNVSVGGYLAVGFYNKETNIKIKPRINRLVAMTFLDCYYDGCTVDHKDNDPSNNNIENLRVCTEKQNHFNSKKRERTKSKYKGVTTSYNNKTNPWVMQIKGTERRITTYHKTELEAAKKYDECAILLHGEFAKTNEMLGLYD